MAHTKYDTTIVATTEEEAVENLVEFLQKEHRYELEQIEIIVRGDFREALEDKYGEV